MRGVDALLTVPPEPLAASHSSKGPFAGRREASIAGTAHCRDGGWGCRANWRAGPVGRARRGRAPAFRAAAACWGEGHTIASSAAAAAAEMVAATHGLGYMVLTASQFLQTATVIMGIVIIAAIAYAFDMLMRWLERRLVPWKGRM